MSLPNLTVVLAAQIFRFCFQGVNQANEENVKGSGIFKRSVHLVSFNANQVPTAHKMHFVWIKNTPTG